MQKRECSQCGAAVSAIDYRCKYCKTPIFISAGPAPSQSASTADSTAEIPSSISGTRTLCSYKDKRDTHDFPITAPPQSLPSDRSRLFQLLAAFSVIVTLFVLLVILLSLFHESDSGSSEATQLSRQNGTTDSKEPETPVEPRKSQSSPRFEDYPATALYTGPAASLVLNNELAKNFRTRLREALRSEPVFAGEYVSAMWGCGTSCAYTTFVNKRTGKVLEGAQFGGECGIYVTDLRIDSDLIIAEGPVQDDDFDQIGYKKYYYVLAGERLNLMAELLAEGSSNPCSDLAATSWDILDRAQQRALEQRATQEPTQLADVATPVTNHYASVVNTKLTEENALTKTKKPTSAKPQEISSAEALASLDRGDFETAFRIWQQLSQEGHTQAKFNLGKMYIRGQGVPVDFVAAFQWISEAASDGHAEAQFFLGQMYRYGDGVQQDEEEALKWYRRAAAQGVSQAKEALADN